jgi:hypothetical protein
MNLYSETITFRPQKGMWVLFLLVSLFAIVFSIRMMQNEIMHNLVGVSISAILLVVLVVPFYKNPFKIILVSTSRIMEVHYLLRGKPIYYTFDELESINTRDITCDGDAYIQLELLLNNGNRIVLKTTAPVWGTFLSGYKESEEISDLRRKIATMTGIKDLGFKPSL